MSYTPEIIRDLRLRLFDEALAEHRTETGNPSAPRSGVSMALVEQRLQTLIMAGIGDPSNTERKTSPEMAELATAWMKVDVDDLRDMNEATAVKTKLVIRSLAASVLSQA
jgi:hypothetical protein